MGDSILDRIRMATCLAPLDRDAMERMVATGVYTDLWATQRPLTGKWGSGQVLERLSRHYGKPDVIFGKQDNVVGFTVDNDSSVGPSVVADWSSMPMFCDRQFAFGYWDPPYLAKVDSDGMVHYSLLMPCYREITRVLDRRLAILHPMVYPNLDGWHRVSVIGVTFGPMKSIRALQVWERDE